MMLTGIFCPHCGGQMEIDMAQRLQAMLSCPYCGRKSLMQKTDDSVQLRGIILPAAFGGAEADSGSDARPAEWLSSRESGDAADAVSGRVATAAAPASRPAGAPAAAPAPAEPAAAPAQPGPSKEGLAAIASAIPAASSAPAASAAPASGHPPAESPLEHLVSLAQQALAAGQMLAFNSYARQAIDCDPCDPRMYVVRARLIEEAHGFARATFLSPGWAQQTPRQRGWIMAQHFATLNAAVVCSPESAHAGLASQAGTLIARQIRDTFLERARLRLGRKAFRGRYRPVDLHQAVMIIETCLAVDDSIVPKISSRLVLAIREELARLDPVLARELQRRGF